MRAMVLKRTAPISESPLEMRDMPDPVPAGSEVLVEMDVAAICRTDLHIIERDLPTQKLPLILGHQGIGRIVQQGPACRRFRIGDRVGIAWLRKTCGECEFCRSQRENLCIRPRFTGYHEDGVFATHAVIDENFCYAIPESLEDKQAVPLLCAGIIGYRSLQRSELPDQGHLAIFGFGSSAHVIMQVAKARGCTISVVTIAESHQRLAREMGADWVSMKAQGMPERADSAIIFAPAGELVPQALEILKPGGTLALAGIHMSEIPALNYQKHLFREKNIRSVTANTRRDGEELLKAAASIPIRPHIQEYSLENLNQALQDLKEDRIAGTGVIRIKESYDPRRRREPALLRK